MTKVLGWIAIIALVVTLGLTIVTIWMERPSAAQYLELTQALLSWPVIAGGLAVGVGSTFYEQIKAMFAKLG